MNITVYNTETKEVLASVDTEKSDECGFSAQGISVNISEYEPIFQMVGNRIYLFEDKFIVKL